jgi:hypothetical protein
LHPDMQGSCNTFSKNIFGPVILLIAYELTMICRAIAIL